MIVAIFIAVTAILIAVARTVMPLREIIDIVRGR